MVIVRFLKRYFLIFFAVSVVLYVVLKWLNIEFDVTEYENSSVISGDAEIGNGNTVNTNTVPPPVDNQALVLAQVALWTALASLGASIVGLIAKIMDLFAAKKI